MKRTVALSALLLAAAATAPAAVLLAQADTTRRDTTVVLAPIVVTGTRAPTAIFLTPLALSRVETGDLRAVSGHGLDAALRFVPGVLAQSRAGGTDVRLVIRGYGARGAGDRSNAGTARGVRVLVDGIPETEPDGRTSFDQIDLASAERIEVVRSNASAIWGNAAGGVVSIFTAPAAADPAFELQPIAGSYGLTRIAARSSVPLGGGRGDGIGYGSFTHTDFDGWRRHSGAQRQLLNLGVQGSIGEHTRLGVHGTASRNQFEIPGPLTQAEVDADPRQANTTYLQRNERRDNRIARLGVTVERDVGSAVTVSGMIFASPKYLQRSERGTYRDFTRYHVGANLVGRARLALGHAVRSTIVAGLDEAYQSGAILFYDLTATGDRGATLRDNKSEGANNLGLFVQNELWLGGRVGLTVGARYDGVSYDYRSFVTPSLDSRKTFRGVTPKLGLIYLLSGSRSVYASVGGGIEVPAGNETDPASTFGQDTVTAINPLLEPIRSTTYEVGLRTLAPAAASPDRAVSLSYDVALYTTSVRNEIVPYRGGRFYFTAGRARRSGVELGADLRTRWGVFSRGAFTVTRNTYTEYVVDSVHYGRPGALADYSGNRIVGLPELVANLDLGAEVPGWRGMRVALGLEHVGRYFVDDANTVQVPAYSVLELTAELRQPIRLTESWGLRGFIGVHNLADRRYIGSAFLNPDVLGGVPVAFEPGMARSVTMSLSLARLR